MAEVPLIQRARYTLNSATSHSDHVFKLDLPLYSREDNFLKILKRSENGWKIPFSFQDGNLKDVENTFQLNLRCSFSAGFLKFVSYYIIYKIKRVPWNVNEKYDSITVDSARIYFVNRVKNKCSSYNLNFERTEEYEGFRLGISAVDKTQCVIWKRNYSEIIVTVAVTKRLEGSVKNLPTNLMATVADSLQNLAATVADSLPNLAAKGTFSKYFLREKLSDFKVVAGETVFPAHRFVLTESAPFFERMFSIEMVENQKQEWKIDDFDADVVEEFLEFTYKGTSKNLTLESQNTKILKELFRIGHKYDVLSLQIQSESLLKKLINYENVISLYHLGFLYESGSLMAAAKMYFKRFKLQILPDGDALSQLQMDYPPDMVHELIMK